MTEDRKIYMLMGCSPSLQVMKQLTEKKKWLLIIGIAILVLGIAYFGMALSLSNKFLLLRIPVQQRH